MTLQFCEPHFDSPGKRVCDVKLQDRTVTEKLDIFAEVGKFAALDYTFDDVKVADGRLKIEFAYVVSLPCISGITVEGKDFTRKINCGGPALRDYAADFPLPQATAPGQRLRKVPCGDFYADWATALFGAEAAGEIAVIFAAIDSRLPRPLSRGCPAGVRPNGQPWQQVAPAYAFVDDLAKCRDQVAGPGNRARFDYWLGTMQYLRAGAKLDCAVGKFQLAMQKVNAEKDPTARKQLAAELGVPAYREILSAYAEAFGHLLGTVSTNGGLATVMYWEHGFYPVALGDTGRALSGVLGGPLPAELRVPVTYQGPPRLIVPTVRTHAREDESLKLKVIVLDENRPKTATLYWRPMGEGDYQAMTLEHVARGVYTVTLPPAKGDAVEYYIRATTAEDQTLIWPPTAPPIAQTVICIPNEDP